VEVDVVVDVGIEVEVEVDVEVVESARNSTGIIVVAYLNSSCLPSRFPPTLRIAWFPVLLDL
jgi:hypothetical protein